MTTISTQPGTPSAAATRPAQRATDGSPAAPPRAPRSILRRAFDVFASMRLTVVLLVLLGVVTFFGTLEQQHRGLFEVQRDYFESLFVVHDTRLSIGPANLMLPLPGGYLLMALLFVNLLIGGGMRLRWKWRNAGILTAHFGIALLLVAGFVKMHFSVAGHVALFEGQQTTTMVSFHDYELAVLRQDGDRMLERTVPEAELVAARDRAVTIDDPELPFVVEVTHWLDNCQPQLKGPMFEAPTPVIDDGSGPGVFLRPLAVDRERERNSAGCYVTVTERVGRREHRAALWGADFRPFDDKRYPFTFTAAGQTFGLDLRRVIWDLPFGVRLDKFRKDDHPGTITPRDFSSWVTVMDDGGERQAHIYMNAPLRRDGHVFFQTNWGPQPGSRLTGPPWWSVFEVARNPSDAWPKYASYIVLAGLLLHFLGKLYRYLHSSTRRDSLPEMS